MSTYSVPWLEASIDFLLNQNCGTAHVDAIVEALKRWNIRDPKNTIVRTLNSYCSDAADFKQSGNFDLFERVAPNTFRLRSYPQRPLTRAVQKEEERAEAESFLKKLGL